MLSLIVIGLAAGMITGISPCVLPVLPAVLMAGATTDAAEGPRSQARPLAVVAGLVLSFGVLTLAGSALLSLVGLPQNLLHQAGIVLLALVGLGLIIPALGDLLERPFFRLAAPAPRPARAGFLLGLSLGAVYVPCAGPVLATLAVVGASGRFGSGAVLLMAAFAVGAGIPLLMVALTGSGVVSRVRSLASRARSLRIAGGCILLATALAVGFNLTSGLQRALPGYTTFLQDHIESTPGARRALAGLSAQPAPSPGSLRRCVIGLGALQDCGAAPDFAAVTAWLNTPDDQPLTMASLRGQVVLIDFWTYSCINCQRTLPHLEAWYALYHPYGFTIVGVHAPEFAFEHVVSNVRTAAQRLGVLYPIAVDDSYGTWKAYGVNYWPTEFLVDATGNVRHVEIGEGGYGITETLIRQLLVAAHPGLVLPPPTSVPNTTPTRPTTPESYLGYDRLGNLYGAEAVPDLPHQYTLPPSLPQDTFSLGGTWTIAAQEMTSGNGAVLRLHYEATDVYLVLGGAGTVQIQVGSGPTRTATVSGVPGLYTMVQGSAYSQNTLTLRFSPGVQAYDFTFG